MNSLIPGVILIVAPSGGGKTNGKKLVETTIRGTDARLQEFSVRIAIEIVDDRSVESPKIMPLV